MVSGKFNPISASTAGNGECGNLVFMQNNNVSVNAHTSSGNDNYAMPYIHKYEEKENDDMHDDGVDSTSSSETDYPPMDITTQSATIGLQNDGNYNQLQQQQQQNLQSLLQCWGQSSGEDGMLNPLMKNLGFLAGNGVSASSHTSYDANTYASNLSLSQKTLQQHQLTPEQAALMAQQLNFLQTLQDVGSHLHLSGSNQLLASSQVAALSQGGHNNCRSNIDVEDQQQQCCLVSSSPMHDQPTSSTDMHGGAGSGALSGADQEEINTREIALHVSNELKKYSIPQAVFAQRVLGRSQGTLSDLLRNPKPWSKLKSGRETFRRMWKWIQEPEFQRMSSLRMAGTLFIVYSDTVHILHLR